MSDYRLIIIGCGLSGLAAAIRFARFGRKVLILEKHSSPGGLNSYYRRHGFILETGLHAMTNHAPPDDRHAPLNRLFRQLKLSRKRFETHDQFVSEVLFPGNRKLLFSNDFNLLKDQISLAFPHAIDRFLKLVQIMDDYDPYTPEKWISARERIKDIMGPLPSGVDLEEDELFINMLFFPLMMYGNSQEYDMDFAQFVIMFRSVFKDGLFRPQGSIKDFLDMLMEHYSSFGGEVRFGAEVVAIDSEGHSIRGVRLRSGQEITCDDLISTAGYPNTLRLLGSATTEDVAPYEGSISFMEMIYLVSTEAREHIRSDRTMIFFSLADHYKFCRPELPVDVNTGVICFPENFKGLPDSKEFQGKKVFQIRITHPANYELWHRASYDQYHKMKAVWGDESRREMAEIIGNYVENIVYQDSFTPVTIERFTGKPHGAVYGSPVKLKDGRTSFDNLYIAGTDQGYVGITGAMLSGITVVNQYILEKI